MEEVTEVAVDTARKLELEVEPENVTKLMQSYDTVFMGEELLLMDKQIKQFLEMVKML